VPEERIVHVGARDTDDDEEERFAKSSISVVRPDEIEDGLAAALDALRERTAEVHIHLDLDVLDRSEGMVNRYAAEGGPSQDTVAGAIHAIGKRFRIRSAALTAYDPSADAEGRIPPIAVRLLGEIAAAAERSTA
jgi:arginase family enzyme